MVLSYLIDTVPNLKKKFRQFFTARFAIADLRISMCIPSTFQRFHQDYGQNCVPAKFLDLDEFQEDFEQH